MHMPEPSAKEDCERIAGLLKEAGCVLIGAGAGLSAAAGIDYGDAKTFARLFPALAKKGFRRQYELIGYNNWREEEKWAYWATHVNYVRFQYPPSPLYRALLDIVEKMNYFVITTNVDAMFYKTGFAASRIYTPQGDYARLQCVKACTEDTWPSKPAIDRMLSAIDAERFVVAEPSLIPYCPHCGSPVFLNVHLDRRFVTAPYEEQKRRYASWSRKSAKHRLVILELGVGYNSPGVIRWPFEQLVQMLPEARFVRVNAYDAEIAEVMWAKSLSVQKDINEVIPALQAMVNETGWQVGR